MCASIRACVCVCVIYTSDSALMALQKFYFLSSWRIHFGEWFPVGNLIVCLLPRG